MFIVLRKKIIKQYLVLALLMVLVGQFMVNSHDTQASQVTEIPITITANELKSEGFSDKELKSMGFANGLGKIIIYNAKQKQLWNARVEKARERVEVSRRTGKKPNPRDLYLLERDNEIKNPPKKPMSEKLFGRFGAQIKDYFKGSENGDSAKIILGEGLTIGGLLMLLKVLAPLAI